MTAYLKPYQYAVVEALSGRGLVPTAELCREIGRPKTTGFSPVVVHTNAALLEAGVDLRVVGFSHSGFCLWRRSALPDKTEMHRLLLIGKRGYDLPPRLQGDFEAFHEHGRFAVREIGGLLDLPPVDLADLVPIIHVGPDEVQPARERRYRFNSHQQKECRA